METCIRVPEYFNCWDANFAGLDTILISFVSWVVVGQ